MLRLRETHPGLFVAMRDTALFDIALGITYIGWPSLMPPNMPSWVVGTTGAILGAVLGTSAMLTVVPESAYSPLPPTALMGKVAVALLMVLHVTVGLGLFISYIGPKPVTASFSRVLFEFGWARRCWPLFKERLINPAMRTDQ